MAYSTLVKFRQLTHFQVGEISDTDVTAMIADADRAVVRLSTIEHYLEQLEGNVDGSNVDFRTKFKPIADADSDSTVDGDDVSVFYATFDDTTNFLELGSAETVSSIQSKEGIITMSTAPTSTTAEAGVFGTYRSRAKGEVSYDILILAANYYLGYLAANKVAGLTPDYQIIQNSAFIRKDKTGADWLIKCFEVLGLQDKIYFKRAEGKSLTAGDH